MSKILVVDDEQDLCEILQFNLESEGYEVDAINSPEEALKIFSPEYDLLLLDVMMEKISGFQLANKIRKEYNSQVPIIFLTAKDTENDMLTGFSIGADDYITKPFSLKTVLARVRAVLKRTEKREEEVLGSKLFMIDSLKIDLDAKKVTIQNQEISLTRKEFMILGLLVQSPKRFFTREQILTQIWGDESYVTERSVDVHIARLRKKMGDFGNYIVNRTGFGYSFDK